MSIHSDLAAKLQGIIDTAIDGIITIDQRGVIETVNNAALKLFDYDKEELIGQKINILMDHPHQAKHDKYIHNYLSTGVEKIIGVGREVEGKKKNGTLFPFRLAVSKILLNDRIIFTGIIHDLSEISEVNKELQKINTGLENLVSERTYKLEEVINQLLKTNKDYKSEILERQLVEQKLREQDEKLRISLAKEKDLNELKTRFISTVSHEFKTPLSTILSSASLISRYEEAEQNEQRLKHVGKIKSAVNHLTFMLNDLLTLSALEEGAKVNSYIKVDIVEFIENIISSLDGIKKNQQKIIVINNIENKEVVTDEASMKTILTNLIGNAIKYSPEVSEITITINENNNRYIIIIKDQGIGIAEADKKFLFSRFFRGSNVENIKGTGLGLNIVKSYVGLLQGEINFESELNNGSTFMLDFPKNYNT
jgi:hypothetical protein